MFERQPNTRREKPMPIMTRRDSMAGLLGLSAAAALSRSTGAAPAPAQAQAVPPEGIGRRIKHISYTDQGGRPDGVQIMLNRRHIYVGHMFSDGLTTLDASDPRRLKPVNFWSAGPKTLTTHLQVVEEL